jgi:hypothetical protein
VRAGISRWTAIFGENYGFGYGALGGYAYGTSPSLVVRVTTGALYFNADTIAGARATASSTLWVIPLLVGADYVFSPDAAMRPFLGGAAGVYGLNADFDDIDASYFDYRSIFQAYFGAQARGGVTLLRRDSNLAFEIAGSYNVIFNDLSEFNMGTPSTHHHWEIGGGIVYMIPGF